MSEVQVASPTEVLSTAVAPIESVDPSNSLPATTKQSLDEEAQHVLSRIQDKTTRDEILAISNGTQQLARRNSELLRVRFTEIVKDDPNRKELGEGIDRMQETINSLDPVRLGRLGLLQTIFTRNPLAKRIKNLVKGYETGQQKIETIDRALRKGFDYLKKDSSELLKLYDSLEAQQQEFAKKAYMLGQLTAGIAALPKPEAGGAVVDRQFQAEVIQTVSDLKLMYIVNQQFMATIDLTVNNNNALARTVSRLTNMVSMTAQSALVLQTALLRQKGVLEVTKEVKAALERTLESNATLVKNNALEIAKATTDPILAIEVVKNTYNSIQQTVQEVNALRERAMTESQAALDTIDKVTADLKAMPGFKQHVESLSAPSDQ